MSCHCEQHWMISQVFPPTELAWSTQCPSHLLFIIGKVFHVVFQVVSLDIITWPTPFFFFTRASFKRENIEFPSRNTIKEKGIAHSSHLSCRTECLLWNCCSFPNHFHQQSAPQLRWWGHERSLRKIIFSLVELPLCLHCFHLLWWYFNWEMCCLLKTTKLNKTSQGTSRETKYAQQPSSCTSNSTHQQLETSYVLMELHRLILPLT